jgi:hypothetical protein
MNVGLYVPCYNGAAWLGECVESLLSQSRPADQVAVVDDGSTDESAAIVRRFGPRVRLIQHDRNRGLAVARNSALAQIECDVIASVDADVRAEPEWLAELIAGFDSPRTAAVGGRLDEAHTSTPADRWRAQHMAQHAGDFPLSNPPVLPGANTAVRSGVVRRLGGYDESFRTNYEDADLQHRLIERGYRCRFVPDARARHLRTDSPQSVLRTYWGWLRPPSERRGDFDGAAGLARRREQLADIAVAALWSDIGSAAPELTYLSLCVGLLFPLADAAYAAARARKRGDGAAASALAAAGATWRAELAPALAVHSPVLASTIEADARALAWWEEADSSESGPADESGARESLALFLRRVPAAFWPVVERSQVGLGAQLGASRGRLAGSPAPPKWFARAADPDGLLMHVPPAGDVSSGVLAIVAHGPAVEGPMVTAPALDLLLVTHEHPVPPAVEQLRSRLEDDQEGSVRVRSMAGHRIGWQQPSVFQQSLVRTGRTVWGDGAALATVPSWRPDQIPPTGAVEELREAQRLLAAGRESEAAERAVGALLVAKRAYTPLAEERERALQQAWPEAPQLSALRQMPAAEAVALARGLVERWLFAWRDGDPVAQLSDAFEALRTGATTGAVAAAGGAA